MLQTIRDSVIAELVVDSINVPFSEGVNVEALTKNDPDPLFVTLPVIRVGASRNKRYYSQEVIREIDQQIKELRPGGIMGHISEQERPTRFDIPKVLWVGSMIQGDTLYAKGYVPPSADDLRIYLRAAESTGHRVATSIYGKWPQKYDETMQTNIVMPGGALESIDFAPPSRAGMDIDSQVVVTSEMQKEPGQQARIMELTQQQQNRLIAAITDVMQDEVDDADPGTYLVISARGSTRIPRPGESSSDGMDGVSPGGRTTPSVQVSIESTRENWSEPEGGTMDRSEVLRTITLAEMSQLPEEVRNHIAAEAERTAREQGRRESMTPVAEMLGLPADSKDATVLASIAEIQKNLAGMRQEEQRRTVNEKIDSLLSAQVNGEGDGVATARTMVRRLVVAEMKNQTIEEAERAVTNTLADSAVQSLISTLVEKKPAASTEEKQPVSEMVQPGAVLSPSNQDRAGQRGGDQPTSSFRKVAIVGTPG